MILFILNLDNANSILFIFLMLIDQVIGVLSFYHCAKYYCQVFM